MTNDRIEIPLTLSIHPGEARALAEGLTGDDNDFILSMERALRERIAEAVRPGERPPFDPEAEIEFADGRHDDLRARLAGVALEQSIQRRVYGPYA